jgi:hypothetical protein
LVGISIVYEIRLFAERILQFPAFGHSDFARLRTNQPADGKTHQMFVELKPIVSSRKPCTLIYNSDVNKLPVLGKD